MNQKKCKSASFTFLAMFIIFMDCYLAFYKLKFGFYWDEPFLIAQGECFSRNIQFIRDSWSPFQFAGILIAPLSYIHRIACGSNDGIIFFFRIVWLVIQNILAFFAFYVASKMKIQVVLEKKISCGSNDTAVAIAVGLFSYFPYFYSVNYKTLSYWCVSFMLLILLWMNISISYIKCVVLGIMLSASVLFYPLTIIMVCPIILALVYICNKKNVYRYIGVFILTCIVCGVLFITYSVSVIGMNSFISNLPKLMGMEGYSQNIFSKIPKHLIYYIAALAANFAAVNIIDRFKNKFSMDIMYSLYIGAFFLLIIITKIETVTISRINYFMGFLFTLTVIFIFKYTGHREKKFYLIMYIIPISFYIFAVIFTTYQGIAVSCMACILTILPLFMILSESNLNLKKCRLMIVMILVASDLIIVPAVYTTNLTVFHKTKSIESGPAKGIRPLEEYVNSDCEEWQLMVDKYITSIDKPLLLGNEYAAVGYLYSNVESYGTYSPGYIVYDSDRLVDFYGENENLEPSVVIIKVSELPCSFSTFLDNYPIGKYLKNRSLFWKKDGNYVIAKESDDWIDSTLKNDN